MHHPPTHLQRLLRLSKAYHHLLEQRLSPLGISRTQARALTLLAEREGQTATDLQPHVHVEPATMTRLLQGLERMGLVERRPHPTDGRASLLYVTTEGRQRVSDTREVLLQCDQLLTSVLSVDERTALEGLLDRLQSHADRLVDRPGACMHPNGDPR